MQSDNEKIVESFVLNTLKAGLVQAESFSLTLWKWTGMVPYLRLILLAVILGLVVYFTQCGTSKSDQKVSTQTDAVVTKTVEEQHAETKADAAVTQVQNVDKVIVQRQAAVKKVQSERKQNISLDESVQAQHAAYPDMANNPPSGKTVVVTQEYLDDSTQALKENPVLKQANAALTEGIKARDEALKAKDEVIKVKDEKISLLTDQVDTLKKTKCSKTKFLFGLISNTRCH